jgi:hypothetical protein
MRKAWTNGETFLGERLKNPAQVPATAAEVALPPYLESFLAHLRLLVGVPFNYLIPDSRLLPPESIRFFYLDRSWTDRLVDGAMAVGKIGTREQAHHHAHHPAVRQRLDITEHGVRDMQRRKGTFISIKSGLQMKSAGTITGFLMRSSAVSGWPHMDVRAFDKVLDAPVDLDEAADHELPKLRLERLSPSVLLALFEGVPRMVWCEEPHHGVQFGVHEIDGVLSVFRRHGTGSPVTPQKGKEIPIPVRKRHPRVLGIAALRRILIEERNEEDIVGDPKIPAQNGSANLAVELLNIPWRQRFQGSGGRPQITGLGAFVPAIVVAPNITLAELQDLVKGLLP